MNEYEILTDVLLYAVYGHWSEKVHLFKGINKQYVRPPVCCSDFKLENKFEISKMKSYYLVLRPEKGRMFKRKYNMKMKS